MNIEIFDDLFDGNLIGPAESLTEDNVLEVGEEWTYSVAHVITVQEKVAQQVETATVVTSNVQGQPDQTVNDNDSTVIVLPACPSNSDIAVVKVGVPLNALEGGPGCNLVLYQFSVTSEGGNNLKT